MKPSEVVVDGKTLMELGQISGLGYDCVRARYKYGDRTIERLTRPKRDAPENRNRRVYNIPQVGTRLLELMFEKDLTVTELALRSGVHRSTLYEFIYYGRDISSFRLYKVCKVLGVTMDEVMSCISV